MTQRGLEIYFPYVCQIETLDTHHTHPWDPSLLFPRILTLHLRKTLLNIVGAIDLPLFFHPRAESSAPLRGKAPMCSLRPKTLVRFSPQKARETS